MNDPLIRWIPISSAYIHTLAGYTRQSPWGMKNQFHLNTTSLPIIDLIALTIRNGRDELKAGEWLIHFELIDREIFCSHLDIDSGAISI